MFPEPGIPVHEVIKHNLYKPIFLKTLVDLVNNLADREMERMEVERRVKIIYDDQPALA